MHCMMCLFTRQLSHVLNYIAKWQVHMGANNLPGVIMPPVFDHELNFIVSPMPYHCTTTLSWDIIDFVKSAFSVVVFWTTYQQWVQVCCHVAGFLAVGEESGASLFKRELEVETTVERDEQVLVLSCVYLRELSRLQHASKPGLFHRCCPGISRAWPLGYVGGLVPGTSLWVDWVSDSQSYRRQA